MRSFKEVVENLVELVMREGGAPDGELGACLMEIKYHMEMDAEVTDEIMDLLTPECRKVALTGMAILLAQTIQ